MEVAAGDSSHSSYDASESESSGSQAGKKIQLSTIMKRMHKTLLAAERHICNKAESSRERGNWAPKKCREFVQFNNRDQKEALQAFEPFIRMYADSAATPAEYVKSSILTVMANMHEAELWGLKAMPEVNPEVATFMLLPHRAGRQSLPDRRMRALDDMIRNLYAINGTETRLANSLNVLAFSMGRHVEELRESGTRVPEEMRLCAQALSSGVNYFAAVLGRATNSLIKARRHLWLTQGKVSEDLHSRLLNLPVCIQDNSLFGSEAGSLLNSMQADLEARRTRRQLGMLPSARKPYRTHPYKRWGTVERAPSGRERNARHRPQEQRGGPTASRNGARRFRKEGGRRRTSAPKAGTTGGAGGNQE